MKHLISDPPKDVQGTQHKRKSQHWHEHRIKHAAYRTGMLHYVYTYQTISE